MTDCRLARAVVSHDRNTFRSVQRWRDRMLTPRRLSKADLDERRTGEVLAGGRAQGQLRRRRSWAPADTAWPPPTTWRRTTASPTSAWSRRAGWAAATWRRNTTDHPLELPLGRVGRDLRALAQALGGTRGGARAPTSSSASAGVLNLAHDLGDVRSSVRRVRREPAERRRRGDGSTPTQVKAFCPIVNISAGRPLPGARGDAAAARRRRAPRQGGVGIRHRGADRLGVDIVEHCEVTGFVRGDGGRVEGVETTRGTIRANKIGPGRRGTHVGAGGDGRAAAAAAVRTRCRRSVTRAATSRSSDCVVMSNAVHVLRRRRPTRASW